MKTEIEYTSTFYKLSNAVHDKHRHIFLQGGMRSGKTYSALQLIVYIALRKTRPITVKIIGQSLPHLRENLMPDLEKIVTDFGLSWKRCFREQKRLLEIGNAKIWIISVDEDKVLGGEHDIVFVNECNVGVYKWQTIEQLMTRLKWFGVYDFNPKGEFWYHEKVRDYQEQFPHALLRSTYKDNDFIDNNIKHTLEHAKEGSNFWRVYVMGELGLAEGVIFPDWTRGEFDDSLPFCFGVDFGAVDPDAVVRVAYDPKLKNLYLQEEYYKRGNGTADLVRDIVALRDAEIEKRERARKYIWNTINTNVPFICDSAGKKMIIDLCAAGINAIPCRKYPDSVRTEIREMQDVNIIVCGESPNLERELNNYIWNDKKSGTPIDAFNHLIDPSRYSFAWLTGGAMDGVVPR